MLNTAIVDIASSHKPFVANSSHVEPTCIFGTSNSFIAHYTNHGVSRPEPEDAISDIEVSRDLLMSDVSTQHGMLLRVKAIGIQA